MKTKVVQHMQHMECERLAFEQRHENKSCSACLDSANGKLKDRERVTFEHRHENKSCSLCQESVNKKVVQHV